VIDGVSVEALERDPYPIYARLRREAPVAYVPAVGLWFVTRWHDLVEAAEDPVRFPAALQARRWTVRAAARRS
jgi:cytochrome P450